MTPRSGRNSPSYVWLVKKGLTVLEKEGPVSFWTRYWAWQKTRRSVNRDQFLMIEKRCRSMIGKSLYEIFQGTDDNLWNRLIYLEYDGYENIKAVLPAFPDATLQEDWVGAMGSALSPESFEFYRTVKTWYSREYHKSLDMSQVLDFGCGWGRFIRYFAKDVPPQSLFGCDPDQHILDICKEIRIPGILALSDFRPKQLPFTTKFDLIYAFSVFTHLSEKVALECLSVLQQALNPNGILIVTVRPNSFIKARGGGFANLNDEGIQDLWRQWQTGGFAFQPHNRLPIDGEITYGDTVVSRDYIQREWTTMFDLIDFTPMESQPSQIVVILRRK